MFQTGVSKVEAGAHASLIVSNESGSCLSCKHIVAPLFNDICEDSK